MCLILVVACFLNVQNFGSMADTVFCGVFDGHGPYGHVVAKRVRDLLPLKLGSHLEVLKEMSLNTGDRKVSENLVHISANGEPRVYSKDQDMIQMLIGSIVKAYRFMDRELKMQVDVDCFCSGTTAVTMVQQVSLNHKNKRLFYPSFDFWVIGRVDILLLEILEIQEQYWV